jgi:hypothetical protein
MNVIIIPPAGLRGIYEDNRIWARQWQATSTTDRAIVEMSAATAAAAVQATRHAVTLAGRNGTVIYAVGHGSGGNAAHPEAGSLDLAPNRQFRVSMFVAFFNVSTSWPGYPVSRMESELPTTRSVPGRRVWCDRYISDECEIAIQQLRDRSRVQPLYQAIAEIYRLNRVRQVLLLTCNVGNGSGFLDEISTDWQVPVAGYIRRVISRTTTIGRRTRVWMFLDGDAQGVGTNVDAAATELMPNAGRGDLIVGRVRH